jgi:hypothetical protein
MAIHVEVLFEVLLPLHCSRQRIDLMSGSEPKILLHLQFSSPMLMHVEMILELCVTKQKHNHGALLQSQISNPMLMHADRSLELCVTKQKHNHGALLQSQISSPMLMHADRSLELCVTKQKHNHNFQFPYKSCYLRKLLGLNVKIICRNNTHETDQEKETTITIP